MSANGYLQPNELARIYDPSMTLYLAKANGSVAGWNTMNLELYTESKRILLCEGPMGAYRTYAQQVYLKQTEGSNAATPGTSNHGLGRAVDVKVPSWMTPYVEQHGSEYGWMKTDAMWECLGTNARILTRRGFTAVDDIRLGDETVGYNCATGLTEWTPILRVNRFDDAEIQRFGHSTLTLDATVSHRWLTLPRPTVEERTGEHATLAVLSERKQNDRLLLAATGAEGPGLPISDDEAALIGWAMTDGTIDRFDTRKGKRASARIFQCKPVGVDALDRLMVNFPHTRDGEYDTGKATVVRWYVGREHFSPLLHRSRFDELGVVRFVLEMSGTQRRAFLDAVRMADGDQDPALRERCRRIAQTEPDHREAFAIAGALEGYLVTLRPRTVNLLHDRVQIGKLQTFDVDRQPVWCPTTGLGSWTAEQNGHVFLTGNSWHVNQVGVYTRPNPGVSFLYPVLTIGSGGPGQKVHVQEVQRHLHAHLGKWAKTMPKHYGEFTHETLHALRFFQKAAGIHVSGVTDPQTWRKLRAQH